MRPARFLLILPCLLAVPAARAMDARVAAFMQTYCVNCHGEKKQKGDFRVDTLKLPETAADAENWQLVLDNLHLGEMPPEDEKQPPLAETTAVTAWIEAELKRAAAKLAGHTGEVVLRRLNRAEYENTIEDLFGVRGDFADGFPEDAKEEGFDNNGAALMMSAEQLYAYFAATDFILSRAIATGSKPEVKSVTFTLHDLNRENWERAPKDLARRLAQFDTLTPQEQERTREMQRLLKENPHYAFRFPALVDGKLVQPTPQMGPETDAVIPVNAAFGSQPSTQDFFRVRQAGWYRLRLAAAGFQTAGEPVQLKIEAGSFREGTVPQLVDVLHLAEGAPKDHEFKIYLEPNEQVRLGMINGRRPGNGRGLLEIKERMAVIRQVSMEGPIVEEWPPRGHKLLLGDRSADALADADVPGLLATLAPTLFRRPVSDAVVKDYAAHYQKLRGDKLPPLDAYKQTVKAMMASPFFLYHLEPGQKPDGFALANRLSYFLWRSAPDATLLDLAKTGKLTDATTLRAQAQRLLADERAGRFLHDFVGQWLRVNQVGEMQPDAGLYPEYDEQLEHAMKGETLAFIRELLRTDEPLLALIDCDWAMLNERLAKHYGIPGVQGNEFRRVALDKTKTVRGGLLTQASILNVTSNGTTTSPVVRGVFLLDQILGTPAPSPPPDVPPIEPDIRGASTIQEQLAKHREIAQCAACHAKIDPFGMALENFDVIGGWRENYRALKSGANPRRPTLADGKPVSVTDKLPRHGSFSDFRKFRELLKKDERLLYENLTHKLATFALGRKMSFADEATLKAIAADTKRSNGGLRTMILALVSSEMFVRQ
jgi:cytochrome c553